MHIIGRYIVCSMYDEEVHEVLDISPTDVVDDLVLETSTYSTYSTGEYYEFISLMQFLGIGIGLIQLYEPIKIMVS